MVESKRNIASETTRIESQPVLERLEKQVHKDVIEKKHVHETRKQDILEVHEKPVEKHILHPHQEVHVKEASSFDVIGKEKAMSERAQVLTDMREQDKMRPVKVTEREDLTVTKQSPSLSSEKLVRKEVIQKPVVTEIHNQPITEIHEQDIHKTIYEKPIVKVVRDAPVQEKVVISSNKPLASEKTKLL